MSLTRCLLSPFPQGNRGIFEDINALREAFGSLIVWNDMTVTDGDLLATIADRISVMNASFNDRTGIFEQPYVPCFHQGELHAIGEMPAISTLPCIKRPLAAHLTFSPVFSRTAGDVRRFVPENETESTCTIIGGVTVCASQLRNFYEMVLRALLEGDIDRGNKTIRIDLAADGVASTTLRKITSLHLSHFHSSFCAHCSPFKEIYGENSPVLLIILCRVNRPP